MSDPNDAYIIARVEQIMRQLIYERQRQYPALQEPTTIQYLVRFATDIVTSMLNRDDKATALTQQLLADLAPNPVPSEALTSLNEAFCKELVTLLSASLEENMRLRVVRQITHTQISVRMAITNAHLQSLLARRHHE